MRQHRHPGAIAQTALIGGSHTGTRHFSRHGVAILALEDPANSNRDIFRDKTSRFGAMPSDPMPIAPPLLISCQKSRHFGMIGPSNRPPSKPTEFEGFGRSNRETMPNGVRTARDSEIVSALRAQFITARTSVSEGCHA